MMSSRNASVICAGAAVALALVAGAAASTGAIPFIGVFVPLVLAVPLLTLRYLGFGVALLPVLGVAVPFSVGTGTQSQIVAAMLFAAFLLVASLARALLTRTARLAASPLVPPTLALILVWIVALLSSDAVRDPLVWFPPTWTLIQIGALSVAVVPAAIMLMAQQAGLQVRWVKWATWSFIAIGTLATATFSGEIARTTDNFLQTGGLFTMWLVALAYGQALFNDRLPRWGRIGLALLAGAWVFKALVLQTWWFSGWLPSLIAIAAITFFRSRKLFGVVMIASAIGIFSQFDVVYDTVWGTTVRKGDLTRLDIWSQTLDLVGRYPFLGTGPAGYAAYFQSVYAGSQFSLSTHNTYLDVVAQTGLIGLLVFAWLFVVLLRLGWRARVRWRHGFLGGYAQGGFGALIALMVAMSQGDWLIPFVYNQTIAGFRYTVHSWVFLGFLSSLALLRPASDSD
jgi:O-antigen ligase